MLSSLRRRVLHLAGIGFFRAMNRFAAHDAYAAIVALVVFVCQALSLDMLGFAVLVSLFVFFCLFGKDASGCVAPLLLIVYCVSANHSPWAKVSRFFVEGVGRYTDLGEGYVSPYYYSDTFRAFVLCAVSAAVVGILFRMIVFGDYRRVFRRESLVFGVILLAGSFLLSGVGSAGYHPEVDLLASVVQAGSFLLVYLFFAACLDFRVFNRERLVQVCLCILCFSILLVGYIYLTRYPIMQAYSADFPDLKGEVVSGWGISNDFGILIVFTMPACLYRARRSPAWAILASPVLVAIFFTYCRTAMLIGLLSYFVCVFLLLRQKESRKGGYAAIAAFLVSCLFLTVLLSAIDLFRPILSFMRQKMQYTDPDLISSGRISIWGRYWQAFLSYPIFGGGFGVDMPNVPSIGSGVFDIYAALAHNTVMQMLGSCGVVGFSGWLVHTIEVVSLFLRKGKGRGAFFSVMLLGFIGSGLLDTVFFKPYFVFLYMIVVVVFEYTAREGGAAAPNTAKEESAR